MQLVAEPPVGVYVSASQVALSAIAAVHSLITALEVPLQVAVEAKTEAVTQTAEAFVPVARHPPR